MKRIYRGSIFLIFLALFIISVPIVILDTAGYRYNFKKNRLEKTGLMAVASLPTSANIFINNKNTGLTTPQEIFKLLPGDYTLRVSKSGYNSWSKTFRITSGVTTFAKDVVLFAQAKPQLLQANSIDSAIISSDASAVIFSTTTSTGQELRLWQNNQSNLLIDRLAPNATLPTLKFSPKNDALLLQYPNRLAVATWKKSALSINTINTTSKTITAINWATDTSELALQNKDGLYLVSTTGVKKLIPDSKNFTDVLDTSRAIYAILKPTANSPAQLLRSFKFFGQDFTTIATLPTANLKFVANRDKWLILTDPTNNRVFTVDTTRSEQIWAVPGRAASFSNNGDTLLVWDDFEINTLDLKTNSKNIVARISGLINQVAWHPLDFNIIYSTPQTIFATELDTRGEQNQYNLTQSQKIFDFKINPDKKSLLYVGTTDKITGIWTVGF